MWRICMALLALISVTQADAQPSFDCSGRLNPAERTICDVPGVAVLDSRMVNLFFELRRGMAPEKDRDFVRQQRSWLGYRNSCETDSICLTRRYVERMRELRLAALDTEMPPAGNIGAAQIVVTPEGGIVKTLPDGSVLTYNSSGNLVSHVLPDGTRLPLPQFLTVQPDDPPVLPPDLTNWSTGVTSSLGFLIGNLLTPQEAATLESNKPPGFFDELSFKLRILSILTN